ncbi:MAG: M14 family metallopeptidase, partial [Egibacteraceae bacterium]
MRRFVSVLLVACLPLFAAPALAAGQKAQPKRPEATSATPDRYELYSATVDAETAGALRQRFDHDVVNVAEADRKGEAVVDLVLSGVDAAKLRSEGVAVKLRRNARGQTFTQAASAQIASGQTVYRSYSEPGGIADELREIARRNPRITKLVSIGRSVNGQEVLAVKVTRQARRVKDGRRPAALYQGAQHAREWITPEMVRRLLHHFVDNYGRDRRLTRLIDRNEYWFAPVINPDGYDYTFTPGNRLWRKNLRDNDGDGQITASADGIDLNRNFPTNWGYDDEGSSPVFASQTYRGTHPASEPETRAQDALMERIGFNYLVNYHSAAELLLYGVGWQVETPTPDDLIYETLAGDDANPAVPGYDPDLSAELYTTNGETLDHAQTVHKILGFTPEMSTCQSVSPDPDSCESGFNFPDD